MGLCCFYAGQYDLTLSCFERALMLADDDNMADVWCLGWALHVTLNLHLSIILPNLSNFHIDHHRPPGMAHGFR